MLGLHSRWKLETPPRMWRKHRQSPSLRDFLRNTSTYVEKTLALFSVSLVKEKHLHVCGENSYPSRCDGKTLETPPRMWRKRRKVSDICRRVRNTSTYVEKTNTLMLSVLRVWKHLHVCGENNHRQNLR